MTEREKLIWAMAKANYVAREGGCSWEMLDQLCRNALHTQATASLVALEAFNGGCQIVPALLTREMWAASGNAIVGGKLAAAKLKKHHDLVTETVFRAVVDASPYAPQQKE